MTIISTTSTVTVVDDEDDQDELFIEDRRVEVIAHGGVVVASLGAVVYAHPGITVDVELGGTVYLAPGAFLLEERPGALERCDITVVDWLLPTDHEKT